MVIMHEVGKPADRQGSVESNQDTTEATLDLGSIRADLRGEGCWFRTRFPIVKQALMSCGAVQFPAMGIWDTDTMS